MTFNPMFLMLLQSGGANSTAVGIAKILMILAMLFFGISVAAVLKTMRKGMRPEKDKVLESVLLLLGATDEDLPWLCEIPLWKLEDLERVLKEKGEKRHCQP